ncbi:MAG: carboxypeptidase-like regulatory domain-containing protein [Acidobacteria bacterium]|nr:carboxypeptidase-like regulatory domain-containing protein [Acidobacteriota bacterium]
MKRRKFLGHLVAAKSLGSLTPSNENKPAAANRGLHGFSRIFLIVSLGSALLLPLSRWADGQATEGIILGHVRDETGAVLPEITIKVTNLGTNNSRSVITDEWGNYRVPNLPIGTYQVEGERVGFKREVVQSVRLPIGENVRVDLVLKTGEITQEITVSAAAETVRTDSAELAYHVREKQLLELPLNGRMYLNLAQLIPGATAGLNDRRRDTYGATITVGGARAEANNYLIDGISNNEERTGGFIIAPSVEAIQEFKVQSSQFSAEYGRAGGAVVNVSIKSGTNQFHGSAFQFHRNAALDARNFFDPKPLPFIRNQFGGAVGGPIWKDHSFFFFNYEGTRIRRSITQFGNVPEPAWVNGDFSKAPFTIYDPTTTRRDPNNASRFIRDPFPDNIIPQDRINPIGKKIAASYARRNYSQPGSPFNFQTTNSRTPTARIRERLCLGWRISSLLPVETAFAGSAAFASR